MTQLHLDLKAPTLPVNAIWQFGVNTCHAPLLLRPDVQRQLLLCRDELGFRHVRCHGMLSDDMQVVQADGSYDFTRVEQVLDWLLESGMTPFLELSGMPKALARDDTHTLHYKFRTSPPKDWDRWYALVRSFAEFLDGRYGCDVEEWHFEVWNEPDTAFWSGSQREYFKLYDLAARAIKEVHQSYKVGGPATRKGAWLDAFLAHVTGPSEDFKLDLRRCDFVTAHAFPNDAAALNAEPDAPRQYRRADVVRQLLTEARRKVTDVLGADVPLICGEWNRTGGPASPEHDECANAAFACRTMYDLSESDTCQGALYWSASDITDAAEGGFRFEPFHGGFGLLTVNDVRKSAFHAFRLLHTHAGYHTARVPVSWTDPVDGLGCLATVEEHTLRILAWYDPDREANPSPPPARFTVEGLAPTVRYGQVEVIRPGAGSAYEAWEALGRPIFVNGEVLNALEAASHPAMAEVDFREYPPRLEPGMVMQLTVPLPWEDEG